jgi:type VI secretion system secreted protein Hcp
MAFDAFITFTGDSVPTGESTAQNHTNQVEILSFSFGAANPSKLTSAAPGSGTGKVSLSSFSITKKTDNASPDLFLACCMGDHYSTASVTLQKSGAGQIIYLEYDFTEVYVDSIQWSGAAGGDDTPTESVSFSFATVKITYTPQTSTGSKGTANIKGWDITQNTNTSS